MFNLQAIVFLAVLYVVNAAIVISVYDDGSSEKQNINNCVYRECDQLCRRIGFPGGACVGDRCKCDIIQEVTSVHELKDCNSANCNMLCRRMGFISGECTENHCRCDTYIKFKDEINNMEKNTYYDVLSNNKIDECGSNSCKMTCQVEGYPGGSCVKDRCVCRKKDSKHLNMLGDCTDYACNNFCISKNWHGGFCLGQICICY